MAALDPSLQQALAARLRFYRELGLTDFYRRRVDPAILAAALESASTLDIAAPDPSAVQHESRSLGSYAQISADRAHDGELQSAGDEVLLTARAANLASEIRNTTDRPSALRLIQQEIGDCTRCALHTGRNKIVFADGSPDARLMFIGEGPGADEDAQGLPFVGKAGQLLNNMIGAMGLKREAVYIANVVKCRPPGNRTPEPEEANTCSPFLFQQIEVVQPEVIVALGATAATYLLGQRQPLAALRGRVHAWRSSKLIITYHPAFLLRDPRMKKDAWADLQIAMRELGLSPKGRE